MRLVGQVFVALLGAGLFLSGMAADEPPRIYECRDQNGETVYQDEPCLADAPAAAKPNPPPKAKPKPAPKPKPPSKPAPVKFVVPKVGRPDIPSLALPGSNRSVDARWLTPDSTLKTFVSAIEAGDRNEIVACLTASALADWGPEPEALPLDQLRKTVGAFTGYVTEGDMGPYWSIRALRAGSRPKWIFFERTGDGEWKIGAL